MNHARLWVVATIIALIIVLEFLFSAPHTRDIVEPLAKESATTTVPTIALHDTFRKGVHTITGSITAPDACTSVTAQASLLGATSSTSGILVAVTMPEDSGVCLEQATPMRFSTTIAAPANLPLLASVNGVTATTTPL